MKHSHIGDLYGRYANLQKTRIAKSCSAMICCDLLAQTVMTQDTLIRVNRFFYRDNKTYLSANYFAKCATNSFRY